MDHFTFKLKEISLVVQILTVVGVGIYTYLTYRLFTSQTHQRFENTFFQLLRFHHDIVNAIRIHPPPGGPASHPPQPVLGRPAFENLYSRLFELYSTIRNEHPEADAKQLADEAYEKLFRERQDPLSHYFRNLYHIIKFIDKSKESSKDKDFYAHLVRAQLSSHEHLLLFYDGSSRYGREKFQPLIEKYPLLENMPVEDLISNRMKLLVKEKEIYKLEAYGKS